MEPGDKSVGFPAPSRGRDTCLIPVASTREVRLPSQCPSSFQAEGRHSNLVGRIVFDGFVSEVDRRLPESTKGLIPTRQGCGRWSGDGSPSFEVSET